jgi:hypothetical protein
MTTPSIAAGKREVGKKGEILVARHVALLKTKIKD